MGGCCCAQRCTECVFRPALARSVRSAGPARLARRGRHATPAPALLRRLKPRAAPSLAGHAPPLPAHPGRARGPAGGGTRGPCAGPAGPRPHVGRAGQPGGSHAARPPRPAVLPRCDRAPAGRWRPVRGVPDSLLRQDAVAAAASATGHAAEAGCPRHTTIASKADYR